MGEVKEWAGAKDSGPEEEVDKLLRGMERIKLFKQGEKATLTAAGITMLFAIAKAIVGFISGSIVLIGDAIHSAADSFSAFFAWIGLKIAQKKPTEKFPYGFYKAENVAAFLISLLILFAGYEIIKESVSKLSVQYQLSIPLVAMGVAALDALIMFFVGRYEIRIGTKINSQSLIADGKESKLHLLSSTIVLIGLLSAWLNISYLEGIMGILIALFIFKIGIDSAKNSIFALMDVSPSREIEKEIKNILNSISGLKGFENLKLRKAGLFIFGEVKAKVGKTIDIKRAHEISDSIEKEIKNKIKSVDIFNVSFEPFAVDKQKVTIPIDEDRGIDSQVSEYFGRAKKFIFIEIDKGEIKNHYVKDNPYKDRKVRAGLNVALFISEEKVDSVITKEMGHISLHTLRDSIVDVYLGIDGTITELIKELSSNKLKSLKEPTKKKL